tara:strand:- start:1668 stop:1907 length:240 start_codon:yes stop_codon:yes gene_type:complete
MPSVAIDRASTQPDVIVGAYEDDTPQEVEGTAITVVVPLADRDAWLAAYDPASSSSPAAATGRIIARAVLDELRRVTGS